MTKLLEDLEIRYELENGFRERLGLQNELPTEQLETEEITIKLKKKPMASQEFSNILKLDYASDVLETQEEAP